MTDKTSTVSETASSYMEQVDNGVKAAEKFIGFEAATKVYSFARKAITSFPILGTYADKVVLPYTEVPAVSATALWAGYQIMNNVLGAGMDAPSGLGVTLGPDLLTNLGLFICLTTVLKVMDKFNPLHK